MAPICRLNSRVEAIGKIWDMLKLNAPDENIMDAEKKWREICDPYINFLLDQYIEIEKQRLQLLKMFGPLIEGVVLPNASNYVQSMEDVNVDGLRDDVALDVDSLPVQLNRQRGCIKDLSFELVATKFGMPLVKAAEDLKVSASTLKLWCRMAGISRWPYRKLKSIDNLMTNMEEFGRDGLFGDEGNDGTKRKLKEEKRAIEQNPSLAIQDSTISLRNYVSRKAWKKRRIMEGNEKS